ncbi:MAG: hypothetical protein ACE149_16460 [Armatimonadota bacterium]
MFQFLADMLLRYGDVSGSTPNALLTSMAAADWNAAVVELKKVPEFVTWYNGLTSQQKVGFRDMLPSFLSMLNSWMTADKLKAILHRT